MKMFYTVQFLHTFALIFLMPTLAKSQTVCPASGQCQKHFFKLFFLISKVKFSLSPSPTYSAASGPLMSGNRGKGHNKHGWRVHYPTARFLCNVRHRMLALYCEPMHGVFGDILKTWGPYISLACVTHALDDWFKFPLSLPSVQNLYSCNLLNLWEIHAALPCRQLGTAFCPAPALSVCHFKPVAQHSILRAL